MPAMIVFDAMTLMNCAAAAIVPIVWTVSLGPSCSLMERAPPALIRSITVNYVRTRPFASSAWWATMLLVSQAVLPAPSASPAALLAKTLHNVLCASLVITYPAQTAFCAIARV